MVGRITGPKTILQLALLAMLVGCVTQPKPEQAPLAGEEAHYETYRETLIAVCVIDGLGNTVTAKGCHGVLVAPGEFEITLDTPVDFVFGDDPLLPSDVELVSSTSGAPCFVDVYWEDPTHRHVTTYWGGATQFLDQQGFEKGCAFQFRQSRVKTIRHHEEGE